MEKKKGFQKHESSESHIMKALARFVTTPATVMDDVDDLLSERHALEKSKNRKILLPILSNIRYLARQTLRIGTLSIKNVERREREPVPYEVFHILNVAPASRGHGFKSPLKS